MTKKIFVLALIIIFLSIINGYTDSSENEIIKRGIAYGENGKYDEAVTEFNKAIQINPNNATAYRNRGWTYYFKGDVDTAISDYDKAIEIDPRYADAYCERGIAYGDKQYWNKAISDFNKAIEINPRYARSYNERGQAYFKKGDLDQAILDFNKAIEIRPTFVDAHHNRGTAYTKKGNFEQAIADYTKVIETDPNYFLTYHNRGTTYYRKGDIDKAISDYTKAIDINPRFSDSYFYRGEAHGKKNDFDKAIDDYTEAIKINPKLANAYLKRAEAYFNKKDYDKSWDDVHKAVELGLKDTAFIEKLRKASGKPGELTKAEEEVIEQVNFMQKMTSGGEYTKAITDFSERNLNNIAKVYKISVGDINALQDSLKYGKPLPSTYKVPSLPDPKEREWLGNEIGKSFGVYTVRELGTTTLDEKKIKNVKNVGLEADEIKMYLEQQKKLIAKNLALQNQYNLKFKELLDKFGNKKITAEELDNFIVAENKRMLDENSNVLVELESLTPSSPKLAKLHELAIMFFKESIESSRSGINKDLMAAAEHNRKAAQYSKDAGEETKNLLLEITKGMFGQNQK